MTKDLRLINRRQMEDKRSKWAKKARLSVGLEARKN